MLIYIIDAFNVIHKLSSLKKSATPQRDLIHYIKVNRLTGSRNNKVIVIFDGGVAYDILPNEYEVIFSGGRTADELIKRKVTAIKNKRQVLVVSDDSEIREYAKREDAGVLSVEDFLKKKDKRIKKIESEKEIGYRLQQEITEELKRIWLKE